MSIPCSAPVVGLATETFGYFDRRGGSGNTVGALEEPGPRTAFRPARRVPRNAHPGWMRLTVLGCVRAKAAVRLLPGRAATITMTGDR